MGSKRVDVASVDARRYNYEHLHEAPVSRGALELVGRLLRF
jgi:hypothetical protein